MTMQILVTGGAGFIGSHTVDLLLANGARVIVFDNFVSGNVAYLPTQHPHLTIINGDILDYPLLKYHIHQCDAVLHLAALPSVPKSIEDPVASLHVNTQGFLHVLQAIREAGRAIRLVYASSAAVYGDTSPLPCSDDVPVHVAVSSPYALEKATNERYAELYARLFDLPSLGLRYFNVYGARQHPDSPYAGVIAKFIERYHQQQPIIIFGDGNQVRDFIYVADVARANLLALHSQHQGVLNIATGRAETLRDLVGHIETAGQRTATIVYQPERNGDIRQSYAKVTEAKRCLNFHSTTLLAQGIHSLVKMGYTSSKKSPLF